MNLKVVLSVIHALTGVMSVMRFIRLLFGGVSFIVFAVLAYDGQLSWAAFPIGAVLAVALILAFYSDVWVRPEKIASSLNENIFGVISEAVWVGLMLIVAAMVGLNGSDPDPDALASLKWILLIVFIFYVTSIIMLGVHICFLLDDMREDAQLFFQRARALKKQSVVHL